ncbi:Heavy metal-associated domain, HMA [Sesbania bispinosa]|nr:Heavy metal-associated domain, HMA [Sesbania bispinosa]
MEIKVKMDCEGCERRVKKSVEGMKGVTQVEVEPKQSKLTVTGFVDPNQNRASSHYDLQQWEPKFLHSHAEILDLF